MTIMHTEPAHAEGKSQQTRSTVVRVLDHSFNDTQRQVVVRGTIADIPQTQYRFCYKVPLKDATQTVYLDVEKDLLTRNRVEPGDYVEVIGVLSVDEGPNQSNRVDMRIAVTALQRVNRPREFERDERATLEYLKNLRCGYSQLPEIGSIFISLIHPISNALGSKMISRSNWVR